MNGTEHEPHALPAGFFARLARETAEAVVYADVRGLIRFWNRGAETLFGYSEAEAIGRSLDIIVPERQREQHWAGYAETMRTGRTRYDAGELLAVPALRKDGSRISIEFTILPFRSASGRVAGIAAIMRDVTKRFEELKSLRKELAAATANKE